jgi:hypothetical protein
MPINRNTFWIAFAQRHEHIGSIQQRLRVSYPRFLGLLRRELVPIVLSTGDHSSRNIECDRVRRVDRVLFGVYAINDCWV